MDDSKGIFALGFRDLDIRFRVQRVSSNWGFRDVELRVRGRFGV